MTASAGRHPAPSDATRPRVAFVVNGTPGSAMADRARAFSARLADRFAITTMFREGGKVAAIGRLRRALASADPQLVYVFDIGYSGVAAASLHRRLRGVPMVVDTGDAITELAQSMGRGRTGILLTRLLEAHALRAAAHVVVRGTEHQRILAARGIGRVTVIQDGVDLSLFDAGDAPDLRARLAPGAALTVGLVGSVSWSEPLQRCYGWELVELLRLLPDAPVRGILVGDGDGLPRLREQAESAGVSDRVAFVGRVPLAELPGYLRAMDVCLSTQTNDVPGRVRTTGKLPLYLALGRFVLASDVGEASLVLPPAQRVPYHGLVDRDYPARLADRLRALLADPAPLARAAATNRAIARERFDYDLLAARLSGVLDRVLTAGRAG